MSGKAELLDSGHEQIIWRHMCQYAKIPGGSPQMYKRRYDPFWVMNCKNMSLKMCDLLCFFYQKKGEWPVSLPHQLQPAFIPLLQVIMHPWRVTKYHISHTEYSTNRVSFLPFSIIAAWLLWPILGIIIFTMKFYII